MFVKNNKSLNTCFGLKWLIGLLLIRNCIQVNFVKVYFSCGLKIEKLPTWPENVIRLKSQVGNQAGNFLY